ncbi:hypothetical protein CsatB_014320 [Cannabis sativa]
MAKTRSRIQGKSRSASKREKKKVGRVETDEVLDCSIAEKDEILELEISEEEVFDKDSGLDLQPPLSLGASLKEIQRQDEIRSDFAHFLRANEQCNSVAKQGKSSIPPVLRSGSVMRNLDSSFKSEEQKVKVKITLEDIEDEYHQDLSPNVLLFSLDSSRSSRL